MDRRMAIASAFAAAVAGSAWMSAQKPAQTQGASVKTEKCYGIARAGKNDCASTGANSCAGTSKVDGDKKAWIALPEGYCDRIVGGSKTPQS